MGKRTPVSSFARSLAVLSLSAILAAGLGGCRDEDGLGNAQAVYLNTPEARHPIRFSETTERLLVEVGQRGDGLGSRQRVDVYRFLRQYRTESTGQFVLSSPARARDHLAVRAAFKDVRQILSDAGLGPDRLVITRHYGVKGISVPVLQLSYRKPVAIPPRCGQWPEDLGQNRERVHYDNFGCATQRNIALTTGNARDLMGPHPVDPRSSERRSTTWKEYVGSTGGSGGGTSPAAATTK